MGISLFPMMNIVADGMPVVGDDSFILPVEGVVEFFVDLTPQYGSNGKFIAPIDAPDPNAIKIFTPQDLHDIKNNLSGSYVLMNNIDLSAFNSGQWIPIGNSSLGSSFSDTNAFTGTFDGQGYVIRNLTIIDSYQNDGMRGSSYAGLFGYIEKATIKNVGMEGTNIDVTPTFKTYAGGIVGIASDSSISNCYNTGNVSVSISFEPPFQPRNISSFAGGICGVFSAYTLSSINDCYNTGNISATVSHSNTSNVVASYDIFSYAGGICASQSSVNSSIFNCYNTGEVSASSSTSSYIPSIVTASYAGGICGFIDQVGPYSYPFFIKNCYNTGEVSAFSTTIISISSNSISSYSYAGGICGFNNTYLYIDNCYNTGAVTAFSSTDSAASNSHTTHPTTIYSSYSYAGGIYGSSIRTIINNCYNIGEVSASSFTNYYYYYFNSSAAYAGGICGFSSSYSVINNCYNTGKVSASSTSHYASTFYSSTNSFYCSSYAGGISGYLNTSSPTVNNCYNVGSISATKSTSLYSTEASSYSGGICGYSNTYSIFDCYAPHRGVGNDVGFATFSSITQMQDYINLIGFDFENVWGFIDGVNDNLPVLRVFYPTATAPAMITITSTGLTDLKVGQLVQAVIVYKLSNDTYLNSITPYDFIVSNLPPGLSAGVATRTSDTLVTITITGTPTTYDANTRAITLPTNILSSNISGATSAVMATGTVTASAIAMGDGAAVSGIPTVSCTPTQDSISINDVTIPTNLGNQVVEYAISISTAVPTTGWQSDTIFNGLSSNTTYYVFVRSATNANYNAGIAQMSIGITTKRPSLTGTATIIGTNAIGSTITVQTGAVSGSGSFGYQWTADNIEIIGATNETYTLTGAEAGKTIRCIITRDNNTGDVTATLENTVPFSIVINSTGTTGVDSISLNQSVGRVGDMISVNYILSNSGTANSMITFTGVTGILPIMTTGTGTVSYNINASDSVNGVITIEAEFIHTNLSLRILSFDNENRTVVFGDSDFANIATPSLGTGTVTYESSDTDVVTVSSLGVVSIVGVGSATITATISATTTHSLATASYTVTVNKASQFAPVGLDKTNQSALGTNDGTITGVTTAMEYRLNTDSIYIPATGTTITELMPGTYHVRYSATATHSASTDTIVTILEYRTLSFEQGNQTVVFGDSDFTNTATPSSGVGTVTYESSDTDVVTVSNISASQKLCNLMKAQVLKRHQGLRDRGGTAYNFAMSNTTTVNAYCEGLFITGSKDQQFFNPESQLMKFSEAYFAGIQEYFGLSATVPTTTPTAPSVTTPANNGKLYRVQVGAYSVKSNADAMLAKVKAAGFKDAFIRFSD